MSRSVEFQGVKAEILKRTGSSTSDRVQFRAISDEEITAGQMAELQAMLGYHPCGYGGPMGIARSDGGKVARWCCSASCD